MAGLNIHQVYVANPITTNASTDLMYFGQSPYGAGNDAAMLYSSFFLQVNPPIPTNNLVANIAGITQQPGAHTLTALIDAAIGNAEGDILYRGASVWSVLAPGTAGALFQTGGASAIPAYSTSTYPATNAINTLLYASAANVMSALATGNSGVLVTSAAGVPSISTTLPAGLTIPGYQASLTLPLPLAQGGTNANLTAALGAIPYSTASAIAFLAPTATAGQLILSGSNAAPTFSTTTYPSTNAINTLLYASAANVMSALATANNGILITSATGVPSILADGTTGQVLTATTGAPASWAAPAASGTVSAGTQYDLGYYATTSSTISPLATGNSGVLITSAGGIPSISSTLPGSLVIPSPKITTGIYDVNGNEIIGLIASASAVNYIQINNNSAASPTVGMNATGTSASVNLALASKDASIFFQDTTLAAATRWYNAGNTHFVGLTVGTLAADITYTLPAVDGAANSVLTTNGAGVWSFQTAAAALPSGTMFNLQSTTLTTVVSNATNNSFATIAGLAVTITPTSASSKVLVRATLTWSANASTYFCGFQLLRGSTPIGIATSTSGSTAMGAGAYFSIAVTANDIATVVLEFEDSPATTSATTYSVQSWTGGAQTITINAANSDTGLLSFPRGVSTITVVEVHA